MNETMIEQVMESLRALIRSIETAIAPHGSSPVLLSGSLSRVGSAAADAFAEGPPKRLGRNQRCVCGPGLRFKHCHGKLQTTHNNTYGTVG